MSKKAEKYTLLQDEDGDDTSDTNIKQASSIWHNRYVMESWAFKVLVATIMLLSLSYNAIFVFDSNNIRSFNGRQKSTYGNLLDHYDMQASSLTKAKLQNVVEKPFHWNTVFSDVNSTDINTLWYEGLP